MSCKWDHLECVFFLANSKILLKNGAIALENTTINTIEYSAIMGRLTNLALPFKLLEEIWASKMTTQLKLKLNQTFWNSFDFLRHILIVFYWVFCDIYSKFIRNFGGIKVCQSVLDNTDKIFVNQFSIFRIYSHKAAAACTSQSFCGQYFSPSTAWPQ